MVGAGLVERVYLDTNVYCRPLDRQSDTRVQLEAKAFLRIVDSVEVGETEVLTSDYVKFEIEHIRGDLKRRDVRGFEKLLTRSNVKGSRRLIVLSRGFSSECALNALDALHVSAACIGKANVLLTCDDEILNQAVCIETLARKKEHKLKVRNPVSYVEERWGAKE